MLTCAEPYLWEILAMCDSLKKDPGIVFAHKLRDGPDAHKSLSIHPPASRPPMMIANQRIPQPTFFSFCFNIFSPFCVPLICKLESIKIRSVRPRKSVRPCRVSGHSSLWHSAAILCRIPNSECFFLKPLPFSPILRPTSLFDCDKRSMISFS